MSRLLKIVAITGLAIYAILLIPSPDPLPPKASERQAFAWRQDEYWSGLEGVFARRAPCLVILCQRNSKRGLRKNKKSSRRLLRKILTRRRRSSQKLNPPSSLLRRWLRPVRCICKVTSRFKASCAPRSKNNRNSGI